MVDVEPDGLSIEDIMTKLFEANQRVDQRFERLLVALHDAINRPMGVVPASAEEFYDPQRFY